MNKTYVGLPLFAEKKPTSPTKYGTARNQSSWSPYF